MKKDETKQTTGEVSVDKAEEKKPAAPKVDIIRGRMPAPVVLKIKTEPSEATDGALAAKYRTTNGKVSDIRNNRNFAYITEESFVPNQSDCDGTVAWAEKHGAPEVIKWAKSLKPGSEADRAKYDEARKTSRPGRKKAADKPEGENATVSTDAAPATDKDLGELTA